MWPMRKKRAPESATAKARKYAEKERALLRKVKRGA
jgi:hypothetical protein